MGLVKEGDVLYAVIGIEQYSDESPVYYLALYKDELKAEEHAERSNTDPFTTAKVYKVKVED